MRFLLLARFHSLKNWLRTLDQERYELIKVIAVILFGLLLLGCLEWWFLRVLKYLAGIAVIGRLLTYKLFEIAFLSAFSLIALSALVTSLSVHFNSADLGLLLSFPIHHLKVYCLKALEAMLHASWMVVLVLIPFLTSLMLVENIDIGFFILASLLFIPFAMSSSLVGIALATVFVSIFPKRRWSEFLSVLGILIFVFLYAGVRLTLPGRLVRPDELNDIFEYLIYLQTPAASFLPSRWYVGALEAYIAHNWPHVLLCVGIVVGFAVVGWLLLCVLGSKLLTQRKWSVVLEGTATENIPLLTPSTLLTLSSPSTPSLWRLLLQKEIKFFFRDSQRFSNASFILAVAVIYLVSIYRLPMDTPYIKNFISFVNLALGLFIISALSLRFCYPQISLELPYSWILRASPLSAKSFLGAKLIFNLVFLNFLGGLMVVLSPLLLGTDKALIPIYLIASFFCSSMLAIMSLAIGCAFPKARVENIIQIETSFGGFLYAACALAFVGLTLAVFAWPIRAYFYVEYLNGSMDWVEWLWLGVLGAGYLLVCAIISLVSWYSSKRSWTALV